MPSTVLCAQWVLNKYSVMIIMSLLKTFAMCRYAQFYDYKKIVSVIDCVKEKEFYILYQSYKLWAQRNTIGVWLFSFNFIFSWSLHILNQNPLYPFVTRLNYPVAGRAATLLPNISERCALSSEPSPWLVTVLFQGMVLQSTVLWKVLR